MTYTVVLIPLHTFISNTCDNAPERTHSQETLPNLPEEQLHPQTLQCFSNPSLPSTEGLGDADKEERGLLTTDKILSVLQRFWRPETSRHGQKHVRACSILQPFSLLAFTEHMLPRCPGMGREQNVYHQRAASGVTIWLPHYSLLLRISAPHCLRDFCHFQERRMPPIPVCLTSSLHGIF